MTIRIGAAGVTLARDGDGWRLRIRRGPGRIDDIAMTQEVFMALALDLAETLLAGAPDEETTTLRQVMAAFVAAHAARQETHASPPSADGGSRPPAGRRHRRRR